MLPPAKAILILYWIQDSTALGYTGVIKCRTTSEMGIGGLHERA